MNNNLGQCEFCDEKAIARVAGESDSFGTEWIHLCETCASEVFRFKNPGKCDYCKSEVDERKNHRDFEEGRNGPVYQVCKPCITRINEVLMNELDYYR